MKPAIRKGITVVIAVLLMLGSVWFLAKNNTSIKTTNKKVEQPLHVAVVNEDDGSFYRNKVYQLGRDYINQLKDNSKRDWVTVSRSIAENGLKKDEYQLAIFIPHDFSSKVMDINNPSPNKLNIQYKVNTKNQKDKVECELIAKQIIKDMNQRLTNIYTLNVMGNLYNAQNQVKDIYHRQGKLSNQYKTQLSQPIEQYSKSFPNLYEQSNQTLKDNKELANTFKDFNNEAYQPILNQLGDAKDQVKTLIHEQSDSDSNQAKIISQLLQMNQKVFDDGLQESMSEMSQENQKLKNDIQQYNQEQSSNQEAIKALEKQFEDYKKQSQEQIEQLSQQYKDQQKKYQEQVKTMSDMLEQQKSDNAEIPKNIQESINEKYKTNQLTLGDFIQVNNPKLYEALQEQYHNVDSLQRLYSELPFSKLPKDFEKMTTSEDLKDINSCLDQLEAVENSLKKQGLYIDNNINNQELKNYKTLYDEYQKAIDDLKEEGPKEIVLSNMSYIKGDYFILELPKEISLSQKDLTDFGIKIYPLNNNNYILKVTKNISNLTIPIKFTSEQIKYPIKDITLTYIDMSKMNHLSSSSSIKNDSTEVTTSNEHESHSSDHSTTDISSIDNTSSDDSQTTSTSDNQDTESTSSDDSQTTSTSDNQDTESTSSDDSQTTSTSDDQDTESTSSDDSQTTSTSDDQDIENTSPDDIIEHIKEKKWTIHLNVALQFKSLEKVSNKYIKLQQKIAQWEERYHQFAKLASERIKQYKKDQIPVVLEVDINKPLNQLLQDLMKQRESQIQSLIEQLNKENFDEELALETIESKFDKIELGQIKVVNQIDKQLSSLDKWIKKLNNISSQQPTDTDVEKHNAEMKQLLSSINDLRVATNDTKKEANDNNKSFNDIYDSFHQFGSTIKDVEKESKGLNKDSKDLQSDFNKELAKSNDFNKAFMNVLNNAYKDGVPNEQLMKFMAQPVQGKGKYIINDKTVSYQLFIWVLVLSLISWLISSLIISIKDTLYTHYFSKVQTNREKQIIRLIMLSICSIVSGVLVAYLASQQLSISHNDLLWWYLSVIIISLFLSLWCYTSLNYIPIIGTILNFVLLMIYLFNEQHFFHSSLLTAMNILNHFEQLMIGVLLHQSQIFITLFIMVDIIIIMIVILIVIPKWKGKKHYEH